MQSSDSSSVHVLAAGPQSAISVLHRHALESILGFCSLNELSCIVQVSREWSAAVRSMKSIDAIISFAWYSPSRGLAPRDSSVLLRHLASILPVDEDSYGFRLTPSALAVLSQRAVNLRELHCEVALTPLSPVLSLPSKLRVLDLRLTESVNGDVLNALLVALSSLQLLESLSIHLVHTHTQVDFSLLRAPSLRSLTYSSGFQLTFPQLDSFRSPYFAALDKLDLSNATPESLMYLLRAPHQLRWRQIAAQDRFPCTPRHSVALASLSSTLTSLSVIASDISFLSHMTQLTSLQLAIGKQFYDDDPFSAAPVLAAFTAGPALTTLELQSPLTCAELGTLLSHLLPLLTSLTLKNMEELESLACFSECGALKSTLQELKLIYCRHADLSPANLSHLRELRALRSLEIEDSFNDELSDADQQAWEPPSLLCPTLTRFEYS